ncbi:MAG: beta-lactamase family protein [Pseudomonadales bacterium]|nr:beta-lactamase family protein [Pseudomonadales bacterium]
MSLALRPVASLLILAGLTACSEPASEPEPPAAQQSAVETAPAAQVDAAEVRNIEITLGSAVKRLCSSVLIGQRSIDHVMAHELSNPVLQEVSFSFEGDLVTAEGMGQTVSALYREELGCTLVKDRTEEQLRAQFDAQAYPARVAVSDGEWPLGNRVSLPDEIPGVDLSAINTAVDRAFDDIEADQDIDTRAVLVIHQGRIIAEQYAPPFDASMPQLGWSMTKTVTAALTGMLVGDGLLQVDAPAPVPEWQGNGDPRQAITLENLLQMSSGLQFSEVYTAGSMSDVILMLYTTGDTAGFTASMPLAEEPGSTFYYSSGTTNIISRINRSVFDDLQSYFNFPRERLFNKLGMDSAVLEPDATGTFVGSSYMYATPRDWAKIGLLYQQDGMWNGERILPEGWVEYSLTPASSAEQGEYGIQIWLNAGAPDDPGDRSHPGLPTNAFYLSGFEGQNIVVLPDQELIVMRMGLTTRGPRPIWALTEAVLDAMTP